jgi:hypothetical protein
MPAQYLDEYIRELKRDGAEALRARLAAPVLIVTKAGGELQGQGDAPASEATVMASSSGWRLQELSLLNRVFPVAKGPFAPPGPVSLGRADSADVSVREESISKRHCLFEVGPGGVQVVDCASTNGTSVDGKPLPPNAPQALAGGETLIIGNFAFLFHTPDTFLAYLGQLSGAR